MLWNVETGIKMQYEPGEQGIRGKTVVIVGSTSGLSQATAELLAQNGAPVFIVVASADELSQSLNRVEQVGGEARGMVLNLCCPEEARQFFDQAEDWLGRIDAVVSYLTMAPGSAAGEAEACQNVVMREAVERIGRKPGGQIIYVGPASNRLSTSEGEAAARYAMARSASAQLRRQATEMGIRVTLIQTGAGSRGELSDMEPVLSAEDVARTVVESLAQPFGVDVIFLPGQLEKQS